MDPSRLVFQADRTRRSILFSYWTVVLLALPLWWHTTSIERLSLPTSRVAEQAKRDLLFPVELNFSTTEKSFVREATSSLSDRITRTRGRWRGIHVNITQNIGTAGASRLQYPPPVLSLTREFLSHNKLQRVLCVKRGAGLYSRRETTIFFG